MVAQSTVSIYGMAAVGEDIMVQPAGEVLSVAKGLAKHKRAKEVLSTANGLVKHQDVDATVNKRPDKDLDN